MASEARHDTATYWERLARNRWWPIWSTVVPLALTIAGALYLTKDVADSRKAQAQLEKDIADKTAQKDQLDKDLAKEKTDFEAEHTAYLAASADRAALKADLADLQGKKEVLTGWFSTPNANAVIDSVRTEMASRSPRERAYRLLHEGEKALGRGHRDVARSLYEAANREDPNYAPPLIALGFMAVNRGDMTGAERSYLAAANADPTDPYALTALVNLYMGEKRIDDAKKQAALLRPLLAAMPIKPAAAEEALSKVPSE